MTARIDLHTHTTCSDGALAPDVLVRAALEAGLTVIAVTDHDTIAGLQPTMAAAAGSPLRVLPGLELSAKHGGRNLHLLGYGFDPQAPGLAGRLQALTIAREERARAMVELLAGHGAAVPWERVRSLARGTLGRPHVAQALVEAGHARDVGDAFARWIGAGRPGYVPSSHLSAPEAIALVREAGGEVALAHALLPARPLDLDLFLPALREAGLTGLEVYHPEHDAAAMEYLRGLATSHGLWWCGGSDFHGPSKPHVRLGCVDVPPEVLVQGPFARMPDLTSVPEQPAGAP